MSNFGAFLYAVFTNWIVYMSGVISIIFEVISRTGRNLGPRWWWVVAGVCVFYACYHAWKIERTANEICLRGNLGLVTVADNETGTAIFINMSVANVCSFPSIAENYLLTVKNDEFERVDIRQTAIPADFKVFSREQESPVFSINGETESLEVVTESPIQSGNKARGWLRYLIPNQKVDKVAKPGTVFTVSFLDVKGDSHSASWTMTRDQGMKPFRLPGTKAPILVPPSR
jgi:hypothetical protein